MLIDEDVADIDKVLLVQAMMMRVETEEHYNAVLQECRNQQFNVPVAWIHHTKSRPMVAKDPGLEQVFKDLGRDRVQVDGVLYEPTGEPNDEVASNVIAALIRSIIEQGKEYDMSAAQALALSRDTLLCCNRTESSGDAYEAVMALFNNENVVAICPMSTHAAPIKFVVRRGDGGDQAENEGGTSSTDKKQQHRRSVSSPGDGKLARGASNLSNVLPISPTMAKKSMREALPFIRVQANTDYKLCFLEDMTKVFAEVHASFR